uniref:Uncharacterized protein n=1 Tax=Micrurus paraensis TaxID=1970185 RepID=A0A2D4K563_9SAUR
MIGTEKCSKRKSKEKNKPEMPQRENSKHSEHFKAATSRQLKPKNLLQHKGIAISLFFPFISLKIFNKPYALHDWEEDDFSSSEDEVSTGERGEDIFKITKKT